MTLVDVLNLTAIAVIAGTLIVERMVAVAIERAR